MRLPILFLFLIACAEAADQPQWGQRFTRNMISDETGLPDSFDPATGTNIKWIAPIGNQCFATPIVAGGRVLIGTNNEVPRDPQQTGDRGVLMCFDENDGRFCWQLLCEKITTSRYWDWPKVGLCSPATVESNRVYLVTNRGEVACLPLHGKTNTLTEADALWRFDMIKQCGVRQHDSAHASPLLHGRFLYINTANGVDDSHKIINAPDAPSLIVLDKITGRLVARDAEEIGPRIFHSTWSSPALGEVNGQTLIFFGGGDGVVYAFEAVKEATEAVAMLKKVWSFDCDPTGPKENVGDYLTNREVSPSNIMSMPVFHNNRVYVTVGGDIWWGKHQAWLKCIDAATGKEVWSYALDRHCLSTPAIHDGLVFAADAGRNIHCVDAETGKPYWVHETAGEIWASPLIADGKLYIGTRRADFWVLAASREKKVLSTLKLDSPINSTVTAANGTLYIATMKSLYAVQKTAR